jgi:hypothetical protein
MKNILLTLISILGFSSSVSAQIPSYVPKYSLIGWWELNGNVIDKSKNKLNGASYGATQSTDRFGKTNSCYKFNGVSDYLEIPHNSLLDCPNSITLSCWINSEDVSIGQRILDKTTGGTSNGWLLDLSPNPSNLNQIRCIVGGTKINLPYSKNEITKNNNWYHVAVTYDKSIVKFYINGVINDSAQLTTSTPTTTHPVRIGTTTSKNAGFFKGEIDDLGIWNRALEYSEIEDLYNASSCINILYDTISVQDTLIINAKLSGTTPLQTNLIKVYPNPAKDHLVIDFSNYSSMAGYEINILDVAGKSVYKSLINKSSVKIDLNTWTGKGVYFIRIFDIQGNRIENRKIIIQ